MLGDDARWGALREAQGERLRQAQGERTHSAAALGSWLLWRGGGRGGCFGIRFVAGVVKISYNSKIFAETNNLRESGAEAHVAVDADPAGEGRFGARVEVVLAFDL